MAASGAIRLSPSARLGGQGKMAKLFPSGQPVHMVLSIRRSVHPFAEALAWFRGARVHLIA
jgi:hypothetical protein